MQNIFIELLPPWIETGLQPAFYDKESGSVLQQTARMYAKVNELTASFNALSNSTTETVDSYIAQFNELHTYVHDYFDNLDVQDEINNKLDSMADDGTLTTLIGDYVQPLIDAQDEQIEALEESVNTSLDGKLNATDSQWLKNNFILTVSYDENNHYFLYASQDGINYFKLKELTLPTTTQIWDISILYKDGYYYLVGDTRKNNVAGTSGGDTIRMFKTDDFETFETWDIEGLSLYNEIWAPEFLEANGNVYLVATMSLPSEQSDYQGYMHKPYLIGLNATLTEIQSQPTQLNLYVSDTLSVTDRIDAHIIYNGSNYYLTIKSRVAQNVQLFKSSTLTGNYAFINDFDYSYTLSNGKYEGSSIIKFNNTYILTLQGARERTNSIPRRYNYALLSDDIETLQYSPYHLSFNNSHTTMMHFTPLVCTNSTAKQIVNDAYKDSGLLVEKTDKAVDDTYSYGITTATSKFTVKEKNGLTLIEIRAVNDEGFANGDTLATLPKYCNTWKSFTAPCSGFTSYGGVGGGTCIININLYGQVKIAKLPSDITTKQIYIHQVFDSNDFAVA